MMWARLSSRVALKPRPRLGCELGELRAQIGIPGEVGGARGVQQVLGRDVGARVQPPAGDAQRVVGG